MRARSWSAVLLASGFAVGQESTAQTTNQVNLVLSVPHAQAVRMIDYSADGRWIVSQGYDHVLVLWDVKSGRAVRRLTERPDPPCHLRINASGTGARLWYANALMEWNFTSGETRDSSSTSCRPPGPIELPWARSDADVIVTAPDTMSVDVIRPAQTPSRRTLARGYRASTVAISRDGRLVAIANAVTAEIRVWDLARSDSVWLRLTAHRAAVSQLAFSPDGRRLASIAPTDADGAVRIWDLATRRDSVVTAPANASAVAFSPRGDALALGFAAGTVMIATPDARAARQLGVPTVERSAAVAVSGNGRLVATSNDAGHVFLWSVDGQLPLIHYQADRSRPTQIAFTAHDSALVVMTDQRPPRLVRLLGDRASDPFDGVPGNRGTFTVTRDGRVAFAGGDAMIRIASVGSMRASDSLGVPGLTDVQYLGATNRLLVGSRSSPLRTWSGRTTDTAQTLRLQRPCKGVEALAATPDGAWIAAACGGDSVRVWHDTMQVWHAAWTGFPGVKLAFAGEGAARRVVAIDRGSVRLWDANSGAELTVQNGANRKAMRIATTASGAFYATALDGKLTAWSNAGTELFNRVLVDSANWVVAANDGRFDATQKAMDAINFARDTEVVPLTAMLTRYLRSGLAAELLRMPSGARVPGFQAGTALRAATPVLVAESVNDTTARVRVTLPSNREQYFSLFQNGTQVRERNNLNGASIPSCPAPKGSNCWELSVQLLTGQNRFTAIASDAATRQSDSASSSVQGPAIRPRAVLRVLAIGIGQYRKLTSNEKLVTPPLNAKAFVDSIRTDGQDALFAAMDVILLLDTNATKRGITDSLKALQARVQPQDVFVLFYSGHGAGMPDRTFYLAGANVSSLTNARALQSEGISGTELADLIAAIPARKKAVFVDACRSGQSIYDLAKQLLAADLVDSRAPTGGDAANTAALTLESTAQEMALARLANSAGIITISATSADKTAADADTGFSVFTKALLAALTRETPARPRLAGVTAEHADATLWNAMRTNSATQLTRRWMFGQDFPLVIR